MKISIMPLYNNKNRYPLYQDTYFNLKEKCNQLPPNDFTFGSKTDLFNSYGTYAPDDYYYHRLSMIYLFSA